MYYAFKLAQNTWVWLIFCRIYPMINSALTFTSTTLVFLMLSVSACQPKGNFGAVDYAQNENGDYLTDISQVVNNTENFRIRDESAIESIQQDNIKNQNTKRAVIVSKKDLVLNQNYLDLAKSTGYSLKPLTEVQVVWPYNIANNHIEVIWTNPKGENIKGWLEYLDTKKRIQVKLLEDLIVKKVELENAEILLSKDFKASKLQSEVKATEVSVSLSTEHEIPSEDHSEEDAIQNLDHTHIHTPEIDTTSLDIDLTNSTNGVDYNKPTSDQIESIVENLGIQPISFPYPTEKAEKRIQVIGASKTFSGCAFKPSLGGKSGNDCYKKLTLSNEFIEFMKVHGHQCTVFAAKNTFNKTPHHVQFTSNGGSVNRANSDSLHHRGRALDIFKAQIFWDEDGERTREIKFHKNAVDGDSNVEKENFKFYWSFVGCWRNRIRTFSPNSCSVKSRAGALTYRFNQAHDNHIHISLPFTEEKRKQFKTNCI